VTDVSPKHVKHVRGLVKKKFWVKYLINSSTYFRKCWNHITKAIKVLLLFGQNMLLQNAYVAKI